MNRQEALSHARRLLDKDNDDAFLESELLLRHTLKISRVQLHLAPDDELSPEQEETFRHLVRRRSEGEPIAYITRHREFYGLGFCVDRRVFIPRPESELLVEKALSLAQNHPVATIAEVGTGCGAIAICLALNLTQAKIYAIDTSAEALEVASLNCQQHGIADRIYLLHGNLLALLPEPVDLIVANLPYVKESEIPATIFEPLLALNGGQDGLEGVHRLCQQLADKLHPEGHLLLEIGQCQAATVVDLLRRLFPTARIETTPDLSGIDRMVSLALRATTAKNPSTRTRLTC